MTSQIPKIILDILARKNLRSENDILNYLSPRLDQLPHPLKMKGVEDAVKIVKTGIEQGVDIVIWGDYDVDGTTGTALLVNFFRELGVETHWHIPNRLTDGYGLHFHTFKELHATLACDDFILITVDCGISNSREVKEILDLGGQVIVTDHHQLPTGDLPGCVILNPNQEGCAFYKENLAGVGVAFYLAAAIRSALVKSGYFKGMALPNMKEYLGFVALGTVSDLVDMTSTNRVLVRAGMETLTRSKIAGLHSLVEGAGLKGCQLTSEDIGFSLGPRINAAGRLGSASSAVELMTCDNPATGGALSKKLESYNERRKAICNDNFETALTSLRAQFTEKSSAIVVVGEFHAGVIGIVASKIVDIYRKPTIVFARERSVNGSTSLKGSGRSVPGINLLECLHASQGHIKKYGGHAMAAGLTLMEEEFHAFSKAFSNQVTLELLNSAHSPSSTAAVVECSVDDIMNEKTLEYFLKLEPFGPANEKPVFVDKCASVISCKVIGANAQHLQLAIRGRYANYRGVGFGLGMKCDEIKRQPNREISFTPMVNRYRGVVDWQLRVLDI